MSALRTSMLCKGCGGTVGDHLAPDQGGCPGHFVIDGVEMIPSGHRDKLRAEVERLRAEADARAVEELRMQAEGCDKAAANWARELKVATDAGHRDRLESRINQLEGVAHHIRARIAELSKPAAKESEQQHEQESTATAAPSRSPQGEGVEVPPRGQEQGASRPRGIGKPAHPPGARGGESGIVAESQGHRSGETVSYRSFSVFGVTFTADPRAPRSAVQRAMEFITHAFSAVTTRADMKPEEPDWTVTLAAQAKVAYVNSAEPADELKVRLLSLVVEGLCNLGREVRRGGKS